MGVAPQGLCSAHGEIVSSFPWVQKSRKPSLEKKKNELALGHMEHHIHGLSCFVTDFANGHQTFLWTLRAAVHWIWSVHLDNHWWAHSVQAAATTNQKQIQTAVLATHQSGECCRSLAPMIPYPMMRRSRALCQSDWQMASPQKNKSGVGTLT